MLKKIKILLFLLILNNPMVSAQFFSTGKQVVTFTDPTRNNRAISTDLYYPADIQGNNVPIAAGSQQFPVIVFGHGFSIPASSYAWLADSLAKYGYIIAMPNTEGSLFPSHEQFGRDLAFLCSHIKLQDANANSFLFQRVMQKAAVSGHSMGGGCSFLAAAQSSDIDAIFNFTAAETNPSSTTAASSVNKPALIFSGSNDCIVAPSVQLLMYNNVTSSCKSMITITGALHCQFANNNGTCVFGQVTSGCNSSPINTSAVFNSVNQLLIPFLDYYIKDICVRGHDFLNVYANISGVTKQTNCGNFPTCGVVPVSLISFTGSMQDNRVRLAWETSSEFNLNQFVVEKSIDGINFTSWKTVFPSGSAGNGKAYTISDDDIKPGPTFYRLKMIDHDGSRQLSGIVRITYYSLPITIESLFPNPSADKVYMRVYAKGNIPITIQLYDFSGKKMTESIHLLHNGKTTIPLQLTNIPGGSYKLVIRDKNGMLVTQTTLFRK